MTFTVRFASTPQDRDAAFALRREVFEVEQNVPRPLDRDGYDDGASHALAFDEAGALVATGRLVRMDSRLGQIGRQVVSKERRCQGAGGVVLAALERMAVLQGMRELIVHAQLPSVSFYRNRGYEQDGDTFLAQGVPHVLMRKKFIG